MIKLEGEISGARMLDEGIEIVIREDRGMYKSDGRMTLVLDRKAAADLLSKCAEVKGLSKLVGRDLTLTIGTV